MLFFVYTLVAAIETDNNIFTFISLVFQVILWLGLYYFQAARYDDKKITAQFGWPRIRYDEITAIEEKWGDFIIKSKKHEIGINGGVVDEKSFKQFVDYIKIKAQEYDFSVPKEG